MATVTYHYSLRSERQNGDVLYVDGFIGADIDLSKPKDAAELREWLAKTHDMPVGSLIITSLTRVAP